MDDTQSPLSDLAACRLNVILKFGEGNFKTKSMVKQEIKPIIDIIEGQISVF